MTYSIVFLNGGGVGKADKSGRSLDKWDAGIVKGMLKRGDRQHDVAAWFGVNGGRIAEINTGKRFGGVEPVALTHLPPSGPYISGERSSEIRKELAEIKRNLIPHKKQNYSSHSRNSSGGF